jgi:hypothetical protein
MTSTWMVRRRMNSAPGCRSCNTAAVTAGLPIPVPASPPPAFQPAISALISAPYFRVVRAVRLVYGRPATNRNSPGPRPGFLTACSFRGRRSDAWGRTCGVAHDCIRPAVRVGGASPGRRVRVAGERTKPRSWLQPQGGSPAFVDRPVLAALISAVRRRRSLRRTLRPQHTMRPGDPVGRTGPPGLRR